MYIYTPLICLDIYKTFADLKQGRTKKQKNMDENLEDLVESTENENGRSYLLSCLQVDFQKFSNCSTFLECILYAFTKGKSSRTVKEWACCMEHYTDDGKHYHMDLCASWTKRLRTIN